MGKGARGDTDIAAAAVLAGVALALVGLDLAAGSRKAGPAGAGVAPLARVGAGGAVLARAVVGAVVEVLVAEEPAPAFLAVALPRLHAGAAQAARVADALVAELPLPADPTLAFAGLLAESVGTAAAGKANSCKEASREDAEEQGGGKGGEKRGGNSWWSCSTDFVCQTTGTATMPSQRPKYHPKVQANLSQPCGVKHMLF